MGNHKRGGTGSPPQRFITAVADVFVMPEPVATIYRIGKVTRVSGSTATIDIEPSYEDALLGIEGMTHLDILFWIPLDRSILRVHPHGDTDRPLRGVFSTRSPVRPNTIGVTTVRLVERDGLRLTVEGLDAYEGTDVIDIKEGTGHHGGC